MRAMINKLIVHHIKINVGDQRNIECDANNMEEVGSRAM